MTKRLDGKEMLGCWVSSDLIRAITEWRQRPENQGKSKTDFVVAAALEKLDGEKIPHDRALILQDGRSKLPGVVAKEIKSYRAEPSPADLEKQTSTRAQIGAAKVLAEAQQAAAESGPSRRGQSPTDKSAGPKAASPPRSTRRQTPPKLAPK